MEPAELWTVDQRFRLRAPLNVAAQTAEGVSGAAVAIDYDDRAAREHGLGRWPWDRRVHAEVLDWMLTAGARTVVLDLLFEFPTRDPAEDRALVEATARAGNVVYPFVPASPDGRPGEDFRARAGRHLLEAEVSGRGDVPGAGTLVLPLPALVDAAAALGHILRTPDADGVVRRVPLLHAVKGGFAPALGLAAALRDLDVDPSSLHVERGRAIQFATRAGRRLSVPIDGAGRTWINYAGPWATRFTHYPYSWLLDQRRRSPEHWTAVLRGFEGKTVIVANLTTGSGDLAPTPFERDFPLGEVHLHVHNMLLAGQFLRDATGFEAMLAHAAPVAFVSSAAIAGGPGLIVAASGVALGGVAVAASRAFRHAVVMPVAGPVLAITLALVVLLVARLAILGRDRSRFLAALGGFLPPATVEAIRRSPGRIPELLAPRRRELTILFADIQGFSAFSHHADPVEIQRLLQEYLGAMTGIIRAHGGTLDKYMGDGILAFFGDSQPMRADTDAEEAQVEKAAAAAVRAALVMQRAMQELNDRWERQGRDRHHVRIGLNTGAVTVGNLGTPQLWDYTVVGHEVNKAQRLEGTAPPGGLLLSRRTYALAVRQGVLPPALPRTSAVLKGLGEAPDLYAVAADLVKPL